MVCLTKAIGIDHQQDHQTRSTGSSAHPGTPQPGTTAIPPRLGRCSHRSGCQDLVRKRLGRMCLQVLFTLSLQLTEQFTTGRAMLQTLVKQLANLPGDRCFTWEFKDELD